MRACATLVLGTKGGIERTDQVLKHWRDDMAGRIVKAAQLPTDTGDFPQLQTTAILPLLAPARASARLLSLAKSLLSGVSSTKLPFIGATGRPSVPFVAEGQPGPVADLTIASAILGPAKKLLIMAALTRENQKTSAETAQTLIGSALAMNVQQCRWQ